MSTSTEAAAVTPRRRQRANGWPVLPMRIFLAALFMFAGYAKLTYGGFFDPNSPVGLAKIMQAAKDSNTPISGALQPLIDHSSFFGHLTAFAEIAVGLGLLVGLLTRLAALGGMVLTVLILLSVNWSGVKEYTASSGWYTSVDLAVAAALSVFLIGGADPISLDALIGRMRARRRAREEVVEPGFRDNELEESRQRLQGEPYRAPDSATAAQGGDQPTQQLPVSSATGGPGAEHDGNSLWNKGRAEEGH